MKTLINETSYGKVHKANNGQKYFVEFYNLLMDFTQDEYVIFARYIWRLQNGLWVNNKEVDDDRSIVSVPLKTQIVDLRINKNELNALNELLNPRYPYAKSYSSKKLDKLKITAFYN